MLLLTTAVTHRNRIGFVPQPYPELNRKDRIIEALGSGSQIPRVDEDLLSRYYKYLTEHLCFPFLAHFPKPLNSAGRGRVPLHRVGLTRPGEIHGRRI